MAGFFALTRQKVRGTLLGLLALPASFLLHVIPQRWDLLGLRDLGDLLLFLLLGLPIRALDAVTGSAFAPRSEGFLVFPSMTQVSFALCADVVLFYFVACGISCWQRRRRRDMSESRSGA